MILFMDIFMCIFMASVCICTVSAAIFAIILTISEIKEYFNENTV